MEMLCATDGPGPILIPRETVLKNLHPLMNRSEVKDFLAFVKDTVREVFVFGRHYSRSPLRRNLITPQASSHQFLCARIRLTYGRQTDTISPSLIVMTYSSAFWTAPFGRQTASGLFRTTSAASCKSDTSRLKTTEVVHDTCRQ